MITFRPLYPTPFAAWEVVSDLADPIRLDVQVLQIVDHHVGGESLAQHAAIAETCSMGGQR